MSLANLGKDSTKVHAIGLLACIAATVLGYVVCLRPLGAQRAAFAAKRAELQTRSDHLDGLVRVQRALEERVRIAKESIEQSPLRLVPVAQVNSRVAELTALAGNADLRLDEIKPGAPVSQGRFTRVPIHLAGTGPYNVCAAFLHRLRVEFADTGVVGFELRGQPDRQDIPSQFQFDLVWYAAPAAGPVAKAADAP